MIETFRMLGREREADLAREAQRFQLAAQAVPKRPRRRSVWVESAARFRLLLLGHEADLERDALKWRRAAEVRERRGAHAEAPHNDRLRKRVHLVLARVAAFVGRAARAEA